MADGQDNLTKKSLTQYMPDQDIVLLSFISKAKPEHTEVNLGPGPFEPQASIENIFGSDISSVFSIFDKIKS